MNLDKNLMDKEEILAVYIKNFELKLEEGGDLGGHLRIGGVYLCLKHRENDRTLYRIFFNDDTFKNLDGIFVKSLDEENDSWSCDIEELDFDKIDEYNLSDDDINYAIDIKTMTLDEVKEMMNKSEPDGVDLGKSIFEKLDAEIERVSGQEEVMVFEENTDMSMAIAELSDYVLKNSNNKYDNSPLNPMRMLVGENGKVLNIYSANKYMARYLTDGYNKSNNREDLFKAIHHLLIEIGRTA